MIVYLVGNPILANQMYKKNPAIGVYAPLRVVVCEGNDGETRVTYALPSTLAGQFIDDVTFVARMLYDKMSRLMADFIEH